MYLSTIAARLTALLVHRGAVFIFPFYSVANVGASPVDNFTLIDYEGNWHELHEYDEYNAIAVMAHSTDACQGFRSDIEAFSMASIAHPNVKFLMINSMSDHSSDSISTSLGGLPEIPVLTDRSQLITDMFGFRHAGEVAIVDPNGWRIVSRGSGREIARLVDPSRAKTTPTTRGQVLGTDCPIGRPENERVASDSYASRIAPILIDKCKGCHRTGGIGPWAMSNYEMVLGFSPMIREVVLTRRMPPWHADPRFGTFSNDRALSVREERVLVDWIDAGSPRGDGRDPLEFPAVEPSRWELGEPDAIIDLPPFNIPASGQVPYEYATVDSPFDRDVWVRATEVLPGDRAGLHHVLVSAVERGSFRTGNLGLLGSLGGYVPGDSALDLPETSGIMLRARSVFAFQMHYTPYGKASIDKSRLGIYLHEEPPANQMQMAILVNSRIRIPADEPDHREVATRCFGNPVRIFSLMPHAHYRGEAARFEAFYADGRHEILLSIPNFDFNWQTTYELEEPLDFPAGTRLVFTMRWNNTARKKGNPNPNVDVYWGLQSWDEMMIGFVRYIKLGHRRDDCRRGWRDGAGEWRTVAR